MEEGKIWFLGGKLGLDNHESILTFDPIKCIYTVLLFSLLAVNGSM